MPKPVADSGEGTSKVAEAKCTDDAYLLRAFQGKGFDVSALTGALDRIERKLEALEELPQQVRGLSVHLGELQSGIQSAKAAGQQAQATADAPSALHRRAGRRATVSKLAEVQAKSQGGLSGRQSVNSVDLEPLHRARGRTNTLQGGLGLGSAWRRQTSQETSAMRLEPPSPQPDRSVGLGSNPSPGASFNKDAEAEIVSPRRRLDRPDSRDGPQITFNLQLSEDDKGPQQQREDADDVGLPPRRQSETSMPPSALKNGGSNSSNFTPVQLQPFFGKSGSSVSYELSLRRRGSDCGEGAMAARASLLMQEIVGESQHPLSCMLVMRPDWRPKLLWDMCMIIAIVCNAMAATYTLVYNNQSGCMNSNLSMTIAMHMADAMWLLSIPIHFITGYTERNGQLMMYPRFIAMRYARRWLAFDVLMLWPLVLLPPAGAGCTLFGLVKIIRLIRLFSLFEKLQRSEFQFVALILKSIIAVLVPAHIMACLWRLANRADGAVVDVSGGPIMWWPHYVTDSYWVLMTMTTVGYGDVTPEGTLARLFSIFAMLVASVFFGTMVSVTSQAIGPMFDDPDQRRVARAMKFMQRRGVERELIARVEHSLRRRLHQSTQIAMDSELFRLLTPTVQRELALALLQDVVLQFPLFKGVNRSFVGELAQAQVWMQCAPGDIVAEDGQLVREVVFVVQGRLTAFFGPRSEGNSLDAHLDVAHGDQKDSATAAMSAASQAITMAAMALESEVDPRTTDCKVLDAGAWFGETCLFDDNRVRTATIVAREENDLAVLSREDFFCIIQRYPRLSERHVKLQNAILKGRVSIEELAYHGG